jgi:GT2 family glycosyltransferase
VDVDVVIVTYRARTFLAECLRRLPPEAASVCVVDNGSDDGTAELVRSVAPAVDLVAASDNLGFAAATNLGIGRGGAPYVLVLNPDVYLEPETVCALLALLESSPDVGAAGCRLVRPDGSLDHACRRSFPTVLGALGHLTGLGRRRQRGRLAQYRAPDVERGPVDAINGALMLLRRRALEDVGTFDEGYWMYMEDLDLCFRLWRGGWRVWYEPDVSAVHLKGAAGDRRTSLRLVRAFHHGMRRFYRLHYAHARSPLVNAAVRIGIDGAFAISALRILPRAAAKRLRGAA